MVEIIDKTFPSVWSHVKSEENASDCASRDLKPLQLKEHDLWWNGPSFLQTIDPPCRETELKVHKNDLPELRVRKILTVVEKTAVFSENFEKYSSLDKLQRTFAYVILYVMNLHNKINDKDLATGPLR